MKITIDTDKNKLIVNSEGEQRTIDLYSDEAFEIISHQWLKVGWNQKHFYTFSWMGRPIIQFPEDMIRVQEVIYTIKPDVIIETGIAHGGSLIYYASLCKIIGNGRVIGIDIEIRPHNRKAIEQHPLYPLITLVEGNSTAPEVVEKIKSLVQPKETGLVILDSDHTKHHVLDELEAYNKFVTPGSYIVATDGITKNLHNAPRGNPEWIWDNPVSAVAEFVKDHPEFILEQPSWLFNESRLDQNITHWPNAWLRRKHDFDNK